MNIIFNWMVWLGLYKYQGFPGSGLQDALGGKGCELPTSSHSKDHAMQVLCHNPRLQLPGRGVLSHGSDMFKVMHGENVFGDKMLRLWGGHVELMIWRFMERQPVMDRGETAGVLAGRLVFVYVFVWLFAFCFSQYTNQQLEVSVSCQLKN